jgi:hypothetical protein
MRESTTTASYRTGRIATDFDLGLELDRIHRRFRGVEQTSQLSNIDACRLTRFDDLGHGALDHGPSDHVTHRTRIEDALLVLG